MSEPSRSNAEDLVRRAFERFNARDLEGLAALMAEDGELYPYAIDERRHDGYKGHAGLAEYLADVDRLFESFAVEIEDYKDVGDGVVLADGRLRGTTRDGINVDMAAAWLWTCEGDKVVRMQAHPATPR